MFPMVMYTIYVWGRDGIVFGSIVIRVLVYFSSLFDYYVYHSYLIIVSSQCKTLESNKTPLKIMCERAQLWWCPIRYICRH